MKTSKNALRSVIILGLALIISSAIYAQGHRGRYHGNYYGSRPLVSVGIGYNPYYNYRPVVRPRIYYHPPYRLPYRYNHYGPSFGVRIGILPFGYSEFFIGRDPYYYYDGIYYRPYQSGGYVVTQPPLGATVKHLPTGAKVTVIDGQKYYELGGTFYQERITSNNKVRYEVVGTDGVLNTTNADAEDNDDTSQAPVEQNNNNVVPANGTVVSQLPAGCTSVVINQQKYYISGGGVYYQEQVDGNNIISYRVAGNAASGIQSNDVVPGT
ncbi:MAG: hypothetical protein JWP81_4655 [Ferruginibacter sp.]|nr:hypothetical protein [Ferruginibacter sp.]